MIVSIFCSWNMILFDVSIYLPGLKMIVKLRSRSRSGEGQVRVRKVRRVRFGPELYNIFGFHL